MEYFRPLNNSTRFGPLDERFMCTEEMPANARIEFLSFCVISGVFPESASSKIFNVALIVFKF